jgi:hypothetical protein
LGGQGTQAKNGGNANLNWKWIIHLFAHGIQGNVSFAFKIYSSNFQYAASSAPYLCLSGVDEVK